MGVKPKVDSYTPLNCELCSALLSNDTSGLQQNKSKLLPPLSDTPCYKHFSNGAIDFKHNDTPELRLGLKERYVVRRSYVHRL